jgi:hypothetical protein
MRKLIVALVGIAVLIAPAYAQSRGKGSKQSENSQQTDDKKQKKAAAEKAYKDALQYRQLADKTEDALIKQELLDLAAVCEEVAHNISDRQTGG